MIKRRKVLDEIPGWAATISKGTINMELSMQTIQISTEMPNQ